VNVSAELLTPTEKELVETLGECASIYNHKVLGPGPTRGTDLAEFVSHIHDLQFRVLAQAAARRYPGTYRLQGTSLKSVKVVEDDS